MTEFIIISLVIGLIPLLLLFFNELDNNKIAGIYPFVIVVFIASLYELIFTFYFKFDVTIWFIVYDILAFGSIHFFFFKLLENQKKSLFIVLTLLFVVLFNLLHNNLSVYSNINFFIKNSILNIFQSLTFLFLSILWFRKIFNELKEDNLYRNSNFYFVSGFNISYSGTVLLFLMSNYVSEIDPALFSDFWILNVVLNLILRILLIIGIWKARVK